MVKFVVNQVTQAAIAAALNISSAAVTKQKKRGMPVDSIEAARSWREQNLNVAAIKRTPTITASFAVSPPAVQFVNRHQSRMAGDDDLGEDFNAARTREKISEANIKKMEEEELSRELIRVAAVKSVLAAALTATRDSMLQIPARMAPMLAADTDPASVQNLLHQEIHRSLMHLVGAADRLGDPNETAP